MLVEVKQIVDNDIEIVKKLVEIEKNSFGEGGLNYWGMVPVIYHGAVYAAFMDKMPIGLAEYIRDMREENKAYLYGLAVSNDYQKQGVASEILSYSLEKIKDLGIERVELTVSPENESAVYLYQNKFSFVKKDYRKDEYGLGENRLIMELEL